MTTALVRPQQLCAWKGPSLLVTTAHGECGVSEPLSGYYFNETRHLRTLVLELNGERPWLCEAASPDPACLAFVYIYPELPATGDDGAGRAVPHRAVQISLQYRLHLDGLELEATVHNRARSTVELALAWRLDADFADIQEAQDDRRQQEAEIGRQPGPDQLRFTYLHERLPLHTAIRFGAAGGAPWRIIPSGAERRLQLSPQQREQVSLRVVPRGVDEPPNRDEVRRREETLRRWSESLARVHVPGNRLAEQVVASNIRDVRSFPLLHGASDEWLACQAGVPLYPALFGRDALTAGWQAAFLDRGASLDAALSRLGRLQSDRVDEWRDAEPGRIPYQVRRGPLALLDHNPYLAYYADFASPLMYVISLAHLYSWTGERRTLEKHWGVATRVLEWARTSGDRDGDGYLEYLTRSAKGTKNQGWKDSGDAIVYDDGAPVPAPIATCELQGYWFAAQQLMALMSLAVGRRGDAREHWRNAMRLKERFNRDWWIDEESSFALAMDPQKRLVRAVTSNVGHCIASGIVGAQHLPRAIGRLFAPDMFSGWGIRTLSAAHRAYDPLSYHRGTVWPVEQATIAFGLRRFGYNSRAQDLARAMFDLALLYPDYRIPECVGGYARGERPTPGAYPRANTPQLWNASAFPLLIHTLLGFQPLAVMDTLIADPDLPTWLPEVIVQNLRLGRARATVRFWRGEDGRSRAEIVNSDGPFRLVIQPPPESQTATAADRVGRLLETLVG